MSVILFAVIGWKCTYYQFSIKLKLFQFCALNASFLPQNSVRSSSVCFVVRGDATTDDMTIHLELFLHSLVQPRSLLGEIVEVERGGEWVHVCARACFLFPMAYVSFHSEIFSMLLCARCSEIKSPKSNAKCVRLNGACVMIRNLKNQKKTKGLSAEKKQTFENLIYHWNNINILPEMKSSLFMPRKLCYEV